MVVKKISANLRKTFRRTMISEIRTEKKIIKSLSLLAPSNLYYPTYNPVTAQKQAIIKTAAATIVNILLISFYAVESPKLIQIMSFG